MSLLDEPLMLSMENQTRSFQYVVNAEGHGGCGPVGVRVS